MIATIYAGLGDKDKAFELLVKACQERSSDVVWNLKSDLRIGSESEGRSGGNHVTFLTSCERFHLP
jgi:hypothetical protein